MSEQALSELQGMVDRLGPGMWLVLDEVAVERYFWPELSGRLLDRQSIRRDEQLHAPARRRQESDPPWSGLLSDGLAVTTVSKKRFRDTN